MEFSRKEYWSVLPFPPLGELSDLCLQHLLHWQADALKLHSLTPAIVKQRNKKIPLLPDKVKSYPLVMVTEFRFSFPVGDIPEC
ncbi:hypothetical protein D4L84_09025 [Campylobacter coli]|nr:hypothetical protein D4L84_09025 [Campylobacter coli]